MKEGEQDVLGAEISRRNFLQGVGVTAAGIGAAAALAGCTTTEEAEVEGEPEVEVQTEVIEKEVIVEVEVEVEVEPVTTELPICAIEPPSKTSYESDVLVVGGGWAGISACRGLAEQGYSVVLVDKAYPGWSGLSAWSNSYHWFDPEYDDAEVDLAAFRIQSDYTANLNWVRLWIEKSKDAYERTAAWGALEQYSSAIFADADYDYAAEGDPKGYLQDYVGIGVGGRERHWQFASAITDAGAELVPYTMITDVIVDGGRAVGAVGFNAHSGTIIDFACKAVIMCTGAGCFKPIGYPAGSATWDGDYIAYNLGLQIGGKEWSDFHVTSNGDTGFVMPQWIGAHIQCNWMTVNEGMHAGSINQWKVGVYNRESVDGVVQYDPYAEAEGTSYNGVQSSEPAVNESGDIRDNDRAVEFSTLGAGDQSTCGQAAIGLSIHKAEGVYTGNEATTATSIPGLYYAGDALSSSAKGGVYWGKGFSSCMSCTQGYFAAEEAGPYVATAEPGYITAAVLSEKTESILAPMTQNTEEGKGFDACWLRDYLVVMMAPANVSTWKTAEQLKAVLTLVEYMRDVYVPKLAAVDAHELRMCHEMKARVLVAEMKLRASLAREESRGRHYRADFPYRDDENFLCQMILSKAGDGTMQVEKIPYDEDWIGDTTMDYATRYLRRYPGEADALGVEDTVISNAEWLSLGTAMIEEELA